jgi:hypothetical protein
MLDASVDGHPMDLCPDCADGVPAENLLATIE